MKEHSRDFTNKQQFYHLINSQKFPWNSHFVNILTSCCEGHFPQSWYGVMENKVLCTHEHICFLQNKPNTYHPSTPLLFKALSPEIKYSPESQICGKERELMSYVASLTSNVSIESNHFLMGNIVIYS